jgi:hypothetical protein
MYILDNWKTTVCGVIIIATGITMIAMGQVALGVSLIPVGVGLVLARDTNK